MHRGRGVRVRELRAPSEGAINGATAGRQAPISRSSEVPPLPFPEQPGSQRMRHTGEVDGAKLGLAHRRIPWPPRRAARVPLRQPSSSTCHRIRASRNASPCAAAAAEPGSEFLPCADCGRCDTGGLGARAISLVQARRTRVATQRHQRFVGGAAVGGGRHSGVSLLSSSMTASRVSA